MKVIKITKHFSSGIIDTYLIIYGENSYDDICNTVEEWCDNEPSGSQYGYSSDWEYVYDPISIKNTIIKELESIENSIENLKDKKLIIINYLSNEYDENKIIKNSTETV